jgi:hypothetical protein
MAKRYRVVPPLEGVQPASLLLNRIYTEVPAAKPEHPSFFEGEKLFTKCKYDNKIGISEIAFTSQEPSDENSFPRPPPHRVQLHPFQQP